MSAQTDTTGSTSTPLLVVGEALIDVVHRLDGSVDSCPGGSPANVAITLARLGQRPDFLTWIGSDAAGAEVASWLASSGVRLVSGSAGSARTSSAHAALAADGSAQYEFDILWDPPAVADLESVEHLHLGSIGAVLEPGFASIVDMVTQVGSTATVSYDPNARPAVMEAVDVTRAKVEQLVALSDVVKVSDEDLTWLEPEQEPETVARRWASTGPALVVMTRGGQGALAFHRTGCVEV
ncbi:MAG: PfkB family carbohydrate kinase, partial [Cellulomonadaceae bacterium]